MAKPVTTTVTSSDTIMPEVLSHRPELATLDYALNDRSIGLAAARDAWRDMIEQGARAEH
ncbi:hypothetical protein QW71_34765 [Paenibacillus sp. IHB B 3415]|uniref:hypothetical protein n=1 Tax=Paenibacillus sp. IHB B 3415 TaxID=867080 RepID=UPI00057418F7|nr:hypothetical protein [Paenibacillus sp. IHB B 3415]KHL91416.1 hypothetical protein QW71_34765 [Paenibacillus sp. IHB B 3415]